MTLVALAGGSGKLGRIIRTVLDETPGYEVTTVLGSASSPADIAGADLVVDATNLEASEKIVREAIARGIPALVATSGWSAEKIAEIAPLADDAGVAVVIIPNFSLGSVIGSRIAAQAAKFFPFAEIIESHRDTKIDSPSGTAVRTAELIAAGRTEPVQAPNADQPARGELTAGVPVHSLRRPGVIAQQQVILSGPGESLVIQHDTADPQAAYAPGIRLALAGINGTTGVAVGLDNFLELS
ncbi:4-hydroxy-tetrahydrodipicolinate reductase [Microbacterium sorbitolivorans]|uniref:4-hydroxy-tetrahydrodipicolinate reductase n=1 Tax=Microbacterium sorbitolivorans TaxID=1867410 RepID=A0A367XYL1_9MICO|nr:4-hydroxy-tetrahydrodipicolinate reductase [Microbacterium sorbitolivorans]RCK58360.1 4-hydroxy-tetrahydrodipicolinate reductase [Microbacterium sorbitolivorans]GGF35898.1 4-hydroxy-tetrahydrodipicolinate reductase [Microbacterium sorbitolivorans]